MNERERWIVYPLLFFALGAALRDKFLQQVSTKELSCQRLVAKEVVCQDVSVTDVEKPDRVVAKLTSGRPRGPEGAAADRFGVLILRDSEGKELCGVTNNQLEVRTISCGEALCQSVLVVDPQAPERRLATLTYLQTESPDKSIRRTGSLLLTDSEGNEIFGLVNDQMKMRSIASQSVAIVDPDNPRKVLAVLGSDLTAPAEPGGKPRRAAVLEMNGQRLGPPPLGTRGASDASSSSPESR